uniref:Uncharacterized protein n=1 Tax=Amphimedon queenslandica TaxID=400682 RepID=A0A1X7SMY9_AMPQE
INQQPAPLSCELTVTNLTQPSMDCLSKRLFIFTNVTEGDVYNYTVTITNVVGSAVKNGSLEIPYSSVEVCPSEIQYSPSTVIRSSASSVTELGTPTSTVSSNTSDCVLPWTVGALIGAVV